MRSIEDVEAEAVQAAYETFIDRIHAEPGIETTKAAIQAYLDALWQSTDPPESVPRDEWIVIYNELTGYAYPRFYHDKEAIGVNVAKWRPGIKPPKESADV